MYHIGMVRVYRYRLYPSRAQHVVMLGILWLLRELYNAALQHRSDVYRRTGETVSAYTQMREIAGIREVRPEYQAIHVHLMQDAITRLDRAFGAFFRRCKAGGKPGFPRFKGRDRYRTFTFKDAAHNNGVRLAASGHRVKLSGIGNVKVKLHRPVEGRIKQASVTLSGDGHWYVAFACTGVQPQPLPSTGAGIGVDVGITTFAALSNGEMVANPRPYETAQRALGKAQRVVSRRKRGSHRRRKAVRRLAKRHDKVARVRRDFHHKTALDLVRRFDVIAVENLNIKGLAQMALAKQVHDAGWAQFTNIIRAKAESAGREVVAVDPRGTSQECSGCGAVVKKGLGVRVHACACGLVLDRDTNAAINIASRGHRHRGGLNAPVEPRSPYLAVCGR
jgi:putative transposase